MTAGTTAAAGSILWVGKAPVNGGGDEVYDRKILAQLSRHGAVTRFAVAVQPRADRIGALLRGLPHPRFKYASRSLRRAFVEAAARHDRIVISHEAFEALALLVDRPVTLIVHNVTHDMLRQCYRRNPMAAAAAWQSRLWEQRLYSRAHVRLVGLSLRDCALIRALSQGRDCALAAPGTPPVVALTGAGIIAELVLSGSYDWRPKRRDLIDLVGDVARSGVALDWRLDMPLPAVVDVAAIAGQARALASAEYGEGIRFGVIPDRFLGGFKLKSTYFIANNCIVLSRCDIRSEFSGLPFADRFVRFTPHIADMVAVMDEFRRVDAATLVAQWCAFRDACAARFSWANAVATIAGASPA